MVLLKETVPTEPKSSEESAHRRGVHAEVPSAFLRVGRSTMVSFGSDGRYSGSPSQEAAACPKLSVAAAPGRKRFAVLREHHERAASESSTRQVVVMLR